MPEVSTCQRCPRWSKASGARVAWLNAAAYPWRPSSAESEAVSPSRATSAANTPLRAAWPAWNGLVIEPKFSLRPEAREAASPSACRVCTRSRPSTLAAAAAQPSEPMEAVACQPRV